MLSEKQIIAKWKKQHDILSEAYYAGTSGLTKEEFDSQHGAIWEMLESELIEAGYIQPREPARDLQAEIDSLKNQLATLDSKVRAFEKL